MGLGAFTIAVIAGLAVDNPADRILSRALISMFLCNAVGLALGLIAEKAVIDAIATYIRAHPVHEHFADGSDQSAQPAPTESRRIAA